MSETSGGIFLTHTACTLAYVVLVSTMYNVRAYEPVQVLYELIPRPGLVWTS